MVAVTVSTTRKIPVAPGLPCTLDLPGKSADAVTVAEVKAALAAKYPKVSYRHNPASCTLIDLVQLYTSRQKLSLKDDKKALQDESTLASAGVVDGSELTVKDLGPQISWRTVFMVEYVRIYACH